MFTIIFNDGSYQELPYAKTFKDAKAEMFLRFTKAEAKEKDASLIWDADEGDNIFVVETINQDGQGDVFYELARSWESAFWRLTVPIAPPNTSVVPREPWLYVNSTTSPPPY